MLCTALIFTSRMSDLSSRVVKTCKSRSEPTSNPPAVSDSDHRKLGRPTTPACTLPTGLSSRPVPDIQRYRDTERGRPASLPHNHPADFRRWEVATPPASTTVTHSACRRCRPPAVSPQWSSAALRAAKEQRRFFTAVLATGEHSSLVTSASTAGVRCAPGPRAPKTFQNASG